MTDWGRHGVHTFALWDEFFRQIQQPTEAFASGRSCPTLPFDPYVQSIAQGVGNYRDQVVVGGGGNIRYVMPDGRDLGAGAVPSHVRPQIGQQYVQDLLYPWRFFVLGQRYLLRLQELAPTRSTTIEQRMIYAVDAAWWINMMLAACNVYPTWLPNALRLVLDPYWVTPEHITTANELFEIAPFNSAELPPLERFGNLYRIPFAVNPGQFNTSGLIKNASLSASELLNVERFAQAAPWWRGIESFVDASSAVRRAQAEDPKMDAHLLRAVVQHTFFQTSGTGLRDFFATLDTVRSSAGQQALIRFTDELVPVWISALSSIPYWGLVRAGTDTWKKYATQSLTIAEYKGQPQDQQRYPFTDFEVRELKRKWEQSREETQGFMGLSAQLQTMFALVQLASGNVGRAQYSALKAWYDFATFRYNQPKVWERGWEIQPVVLRQTPVYSACECLRLDRPNGTPDCQPFCSSMPSARITFIGGLMGAAVEQNFLRIESMGQIWVSGASSSAAIAANEVQAAPPLSQVEQLATPNGSNAAYQSFRPVVASSSTGRPLLTVAVLSLAAGGIIYATSKLRK